MELVKGVNSYMTLEEANSIVSDTFYDDEDEAKTWNGLSDNDKIKLIYRSTKVINTLVFLGIQYPSDGDLRWPRMICSQYVDCPDDVKIAILLQGIKNKQNSVKDESKLQELGVKSYSIKGASISFDSNASLKLSNGIYTSVYDTYLSRWVY